MDGNATSYNLLLILPVSLSALWVLLDLFYASWLLAFIANVLINAILPKGTGVYIGRLKISLLTGRVIFKDLQYYDRDSSIFVTDGYGVLRWWKKPNEEDSTVKCKFCGSQSQAGAGKKSSLIFLHLNGLEYHWYNRKDVYDEWGKPKTDESEVEGGGGMSWIKQIRPSVHCTINKGRILFGNHLTETSLVLYFNHGEGQYRMTKASNDFDELMHSVRWHGDKLRAVLEPSHGYNGPREEIPSVTACTEVVGGGHTQGYLLMKTDSANGEYSVDIPGLVPLNDSSSPKFALDIYLGHNTVLNYGTYANRQRVNLIQKFFPNDYTTRPVSRLPQPGERRIYTSFDISVYVVSQATINFFFEEKKDIRCLTFRVGGDSSLCIHQPWVTKENGYTTTLTVKATDIDVLTSLPYETLGRSQTFEMTTSLYFPRIWNVTQKWDMKFSLSQIQGGILFQYIDFFNALIDDWLRDVPPDLLEFVPIDWNIGVELSDYEICLHTSQYNWIDITTEGKENSRLAFCGKTGHLAFELPFTKFLPKEQTITFIVQGHNIVIRKYIPPSCSSRDSQFQLSSSCGDRWRVMDPPQDRTPFVEKKLIRSVSQPLEVVKDPSTPRGSGPRTLGTSSSEADCFRRTHVRRGSEPLLSRTHIQKMPLRGFGEMGLLMEEAEDNETETQVTSVKPSETEGSKEFFPMGCQMETLHENGWLEIGCGPSLSIEMNYKGHNYDLAQSADGRGDECRLVPNEVHINVDASHILLRVFGSFAKDIIALRDNFPGEYMYFKTYFSESTSAPDGAVERDVPLDLSKTPNTSPGPNVPNERFLNVIVDFKLHDVYGELPTHLPEGFPRDFPLISGMTDHFTVHMEYTESETCVMLHVDPISINFPFLTSKGGVSSEHSLGYLLLSSVDLSCHGFTELLLKERVEYAWMMKLDMGEINGTVSTQQLLPVIDYFQTAANHFMSHGDAFCHAPDAIVIEPRAEPLSELLKYKLFALRISSVDVNVKERDSLLKLKCPGFDLDLCNIHSHTQTLAVSLQLQHLTATSFIATPSNPGVMLESGCAEVGTIQGDIGLREPEEAMPERQMAFLKRADSRTHRLWFVWEERYMNTCGCCGGCQFLSSTIDRPGDSAGNTAAVTDDGDYILGECLQVPSTSKDGQPTCSSAMATPSHNQAEFKSLKAIQYLHNSLLAYHFSCEWTRTQQSLELAVQQTPLHQICSTSLPSVNVPLEDIASQDSDSFHSANEYFDANEEFHSTQNTPRTSFRRHMRQSSKHSTQLAFQVPSIIEPVVKSKNGSHEFIANYVDVLSSCNCSWKTIELVSKTVNKETPPTERSQDLRSGAIPRVTPRRNQKKNDYSGPKFVLEIPELASPSGGCSPFVVVSRHQPEAAASSSSSGIGHLNHHQDQPNEQGRAMFSVLINITRSFSVFLSPPIIPVIERYIDCANIFFTTRTAQSLLEALTLESLGSVKSHLTKILNSSSSSSSIPSSSIAPLAHFSLTMDPSAYGSVQILQTCKVLRPGQRTGTHTPTTAESGFDSRSSLVCFYTAGLQGNALVHHQSIKVAVDCCEVNDDSTNIQTTLKLAGKFCLPVLQAGLFAIHSCPESLKEEELHGGITSNYSFLDFYVEPAKPPDRNDPLVLITNVAELSMNKFLLTTAAKIIQSEFSNNPILMWSDIRESTETPPRGVTEEGDQRDSELSNNSLVVNLSVPSVRLQLGGPRHGIPSPKELCIDSSLIFALVEVWKPLIEDLVDSVKSFWRNKLTRDRRLILTLVTAAMDVAYRPKHKNPLLTYVSSRLRETVAYAVTQQLWQGLPLATEERLLNFPSDYQEGFLLQEIVATLLSLALRLRVQESPLSAVPCLEETRSRSSYPNVLKGIGYFSISPSPSELAITNVTYAKQYVDRENIDYCSLVKAVDPTCLIYIREAMLPFFFACNVEMALQLKKQCHNSLKLNVDYNVRLDEAAILVIDGREDHLHNADSVDDDESVGVVPEFLLENVNMTGSLEHVVESRVISQSSGQLITIRSKTANLEGKKHRSNVTSKCYLGLDAIAMHITLPLLMLSRHTSESIQHWRKSFQALKVPNSSPFHKENQQPEEIEPSGGDPSQPHSWVTAKSLVEVLSFMESKHLSPPPLPPKAASTLASFRSKQATPKGSHKNLNISTYSTSPNFPQSVKGVINPSRTNEPEQLDVLHSKRPNSKRRASIDSSTSLEPEESPPEVSITVLPPSSDQTLGDNSHGLISSGSHGLELAEDTTDSPQMFSSDTEAPIQMSMATYTTKTSSSKLPPPSINPADFIPELSPVLEMPNMHEVLAIPDNQLEFSVCGSLRIKSLQISSQVETLFVMLEVRNISGAIDCRQIPSDKKKAHSNARTTTDHTPLLYKLLPTYLSVSSTLQQCCIRVFDSAVSKGDLAVLSANPLELCTSLYYGDTQSAPAYRSLFRLPGVELDMKEPPIVLHKKFHKYIPTFTATYNQVFTPSDTSINEMFFATSTPSVVNVQDLQFPPHLPRGSFLFNLSWFRMIIRPLSSLTVKYQLAPVTAQLGTSSVVKFSMNIGQHNLEFVPKESKDELSLRNIPLPVIALKGSVIPRPFSRLPSISAELAMKQIAIDVTTDVFNQLLILQTSFIKEINDLLNMFLNIGESIHVPQDTLSSINLKQSTESGFELISLLSSIRLSLQGIKITISTPTQTALRFSTGNKIEMLITNPSHQLGQNERPPLVPRDQLTLHGKVETEISICLGCLQDDNGVDEEDDFVELAYFKTWVTIKNTLQQNTSLLTGTKEASMDFPASLDTFLISIIAPHLYIQSTAVEKAILFWVNCKSVYNYWQNEHKVLNAEVQAATEAFVERITKPSTQIKTPSFDFSKPRLVQITVSDVGACMPLVPLPTTPHSSQKGFPALVFTIKDMQITLNLSKRLGSAGKFSDFCVRFDEQFHFRHKTWTIDPRKYKSLNYGEVPNGTYRFCIVNKPRMDNGGRVGEKLFSAFTWHMSGININSTTHIGRHISTLVRTLTTIGSDLDDSHHQQEPSSAPSTKPQFAPTFRSIKKRRYSYSSFLEEQDFLRALEVDLAKQTRRLQKLRLSGATPDSLKNEEDTFHKLEVDIARGLRRVFRKGRTMSFHQWSQLLYPRSPIVGLSNPRRRLGSTSTLPRRKVTFVESETITDPTAQHDPLGRSPSPRTHARHRSDITPDVRRLMKLGDVGLEDPLQSNSTSAVGSLDAVVEDSEKEGEEVEVGGAESSGSSPKASESLIPSIDIEINVTINVDSGQVKLYSEDLGSHEQARSSFISLAAESPRLSGHRSKQSTPSVLTVIFIPAVEVRAHYQSIMGSYTTAPTTPTKSPASPQGSSMFLPPTVVVVEGEQKPKQQQQQQQRLQVDSPSHATFEASDKMGLPVKKGILSITTTISSLPNDLELNPSILDFVEQVVRPINISAQEIDMVASDIKEDDDDEKEEDGKLPVTAQKSEAQPLSFPVHICLNFQIHPSKIILTCNPHARVRCQVAIPTVSFMVSFSLFSKRQYDSPTPVPKNNESCMVQSPTDSPIITLQGGQGGNDDTVTLNNLNVTGCFQTFHLAMFTPNVQSSKLQPSSSLGVPEDKEVISLVLGQAFIHLSRSSVFVRDGPPYKSVDDFTTHEKLKVSVIPHIESLILFYDWRRLNDVTWFRKCWYHTGLVEALFIGKKPSEEPPMPHPPSPYDPSHQTIWSPGSSGEESSTDTSTAETSTTITAELVVAVSVADVRLAVNVAQLMGNAYIQASHLRGEAHADIKDNELIFLNVDGTLEEFEIDAQGGVVAGNLRIKDTHLSLNSSSQDGCIPEHKATGNIGNIQGHIDYMSAIIMLLKVTELKVRVWDSWEGINQDRSEHSGAKIQVCCSFNWSTCQIAIHRATAKGMFGIVQRIYDFVIQQKKRSERMIGSMIPAGTTASTIFAAYQEEQKRAEKTRAAEIENPLLEYHHWMWAVKVGSIKLMNALGIQISTDQHDVSLGGFITMSGDNLAVVCFHGTSFRETEWAVFNIDLITAKFSTLAIPGLGAMFLSEDLEDGRASGKRRICQQECVLQLGNDSSKMTELAAVYRVTAGRGGVPPVSPAEISEWLNYACINHHLHSNQGVVTKPVGYLKESQKLSINPICCFPAFTVNLITDHLWPSLRELEDQIMSGLTESATVECTLVTTFSDGIAVTTTVENYLFLHDLFKAYVQYLEKQNVSFRPPFTTAGSTLANIPEEERKTSNCLRRFVSVHWELEPRLVLLATAQWASGHFNPHVTWLLEKLGFEHARTTIPKYIQRGLMDPLDLGIASIIELLIQLSATKKVRTDDASSD